jgi:DNA-binding MarR family transcriptional regulator
MAQYPGILIAAARRRIKRVVAGRLAGRDLTTQQFWILVAVEETPGISQVEIATRTRADAPNVSRALATLAARGLVRTEQDRADRRRAHVHLTAAGRALAAELLPLAREVREAMVAGMTRSEVESLCAGLQRLIANLDGLDARDDGREREQA